jgi:hypothetical protein
MCGRGLSLCESGSLARITFPGVSVLIYSGRRKT